MLAIIIPYYKLTFFEATLQSLANQTNQRFKVYIGDDASPKDCTPLLEKYKGKFDFTYLRFEGNLGGTSLTKQWERCIALSGDEEWLMILGDDDVLGDTTVEEFYKQYDTFYSKTHLVRFATKTIFEATNTVSDIFIHPIWENATDSFYRKLENLTRSSLSEYIFSRESYLKYGFYDYPLAWNSDDRAWLDFSDNKPIFTINDSLVFVRLSELNISGKRDNNYKKKVSVQSFYRFIVLQKMKYFDISQKERILRRYENEIKSSNKLNFLECFFLLYFYIKYLDINSVLKFGKRFFNVILKRNEF